jgi:hypothetical protein
MLGATAVNVIYSQNNLIGSLASDTDCSTIGSKNGIPLPVTKFTITCIATLLTPVRESVFVITILIVLSKQTAL